MSEVIVITSGKGGVGKTTTVANLGTALSLENKKTVVLDADIELKTQPMLLETKAILFNLFRDYLSTQEQREKIVKMQKEERHKNELKKQQNYNSDVFQNKTKESREQIEKQEHELIEYKESILSKLFNRIKGLFVKK